MRHVLNVMPGIFVAMAAWPAHAGIIAVPEPGNMALLGGAVIVGLVAYRRLRGRK